MMNDTSKSFFGIFDEYNESTATFVHTLVAQNITLALSYVSCINGPIKRAGVLHAKPSNNRNVKGTMKSAHRVLLDCLCWRQITKSPKPMCLLRLCTTYISS